MEALIFLLKAVMVLFASISLGDWFLSKVRQARAQGRPVYSAYLSLPGIIIILVLLVPVFMWLAQGR